MIKALIEELNDFCDQLSLNSKDLSCLKSLLSGDSSNENVNLQEIMPLFDSCIQSLEPEFFNKDQCEKIRSLYAQTQTLFEWKDGPLVTALRKGHIFLLDEISLAEDSVLERLNSVLEPDRLLVLTEKGASKENGVDSIAVEEIIGVDRFSFLATMNPGGDYGKKELSPALRNRFTEIWVPVISDREDLLRIISQKLDSNLENTTSSANQNLVIAGKILDFIDWFASKLNKSADSIVSIRDILAWVGFLTCTSGKLPVNEALYHGGCMVLLDGIGVNPLFGTTVTGSSSTPFKHECESRLKYYAGLDQHYFADPEYTSTVSCDKNFGIMPFMISKGLHSEGNYPFTLQAPTTSLNAVRVLRALQLKKPILLEGSPGVGKTSLISSLASAAGWSLCRINLSEQTDLMDLFGSDLPVEGGKAGEFSWRDGPFLKAMKEGEWVLLDELNLASQQVLEVRNFTFLILI